MANPANDPNFIWNLVEKMEDDQELREAVWELFRRGELFWLLHDGQLKMLDVVLHSTFYEILILCSRQLGKSFFVALLALWEAIRNPRTMVKYFSETEEQIEDIVNDNLSIIELLAPSGLIDRKKSAKRWVINGNSQIRLGMLAQAHVNKRRGGKASLMLLEEGGFTKSDAYRKAIGGTINAQLLRAAGGKSTDIKGKLVHITTPPEDLGHYIITDVMPKCEANRSIIRLDIHQNPQLTPDQIKLAHDRCTTPEEWEREYLVKIVRDRISTVIPEYDDNSVHVNEMTIPQFAYWMTVLDFGGTVDPHGVLLCFYDFERAKFCVWDERFHEKNTSTKTIRESGLEMEKQAQWINEGNPYRISDCPGQIVVDLNSEGYHVYTPDKEKGSWEAWINQLRLGFQRNDIEIHPRCRMLRLTLNHGQYTENRKDFKRTEQLGHLDLLSALGYGFKHKVLENPFPPHLGKSRFTHHLSRADMEQKSALEEAFNPFLKG